MDQEHRSEAELLPPVAEQRPHRLSLHGDERIDQYFWMGDRHDPQVIAYLEAENAYTQAVMQPTEPAQARLYEEMLARIQETDLSVPYRKGNYYYYSRTVTGKAYPIYCRKAGGLDAPEEILIDQNELAHGHEYFELGVLDVSPDGQRLAYSIDTTGSERFTLFFFDLTTRQRYPESIPDTSPAFAWANDSQTVFYTEVDATNRPYKLFRHRIDQPVADSQLIYHEIDDSYFLNIHKTRSDAFILLHLGSKITSEVHFLRADQPLAQFQVIQPRSLGVEYQVEHQGDFFYIVTNQDALNFKLMQAPIDRPAQENWQTVLPHREEVLLSSVSAFAHHLVIYERKGGLPQVRVRHLSTGEDHYLTFPDPTYFLEEDHNPEFNTPILRFNYTSLVTPNSIFDYDMDTRVRELKKQTEVLGGYDPDQYASKRLLAPALDGVQVPISLVYKQGLQRTGHNPLLLLGYGSYGIDYPPLFSSNRLALLDRGVVIAIAHIRGGSEMGRQWYESGKFLQKKNTFTDFIACAEYLIAEQWTSKQDLAIAGGSAGGLLMGAVINLRPDLFRAVVAHVPFVDIVTTILDPTLPLSVTEWEEWGNPNDKVYYDYMKSYSPYDNVQAKDYPALLVTAGLNDPRVAYWEPAKWTAKLRALKTDDNLLLLKTHMGAGHGGASGRYERLKEIAFEYAFLLEQWGLDA